MMFQFADSRDKLLEIEGIMEVGFLSDPAGLCLELSVGGFLGRAAPSQIMRALPVEKVTAGLKVHFRNWVAIPLENITIKAQINGKKVTG